MAGEIGHIDVPVDDLPKDALGLYDFGGPCWCGQPRHVNAFATPRRIRAALDVTDLADLDADRAADIHRVFAAAGASLGHALAALVNIINPGQLLAIMPAEFDAPYGRRYLDEVENALHSTFSTGGADTKLDTRYLSGPQLAMNGARAASIRVLIEFIDHLSGIDSCPPSERSFATWLARGAAAVVGGALGRSRETAAASAAKAGRAIAGYARPRAPVGERAEATRAPWRR
jgi:predicted NBD/HSP70 family sugar kinase